MDVILQKKKTITVALLSLGNGVHYHICHLNYDYPHCEKTYSLAL